MSVKQVIVIRKDLNMRKGKMVAQGAHASMKVLLDKMSRGMFRNCPTGQEQFLNIWTSPEEQEWINGIFTKICVSVNSEEELLEIYNKAKEAGLNCSLIEDAGLTEFGGIKTLTCAAIGPNYAEKIDEITGKLPLL